MDNHEGKIDSKGKLKDYSHIKTNGQGLKMAVLTTY